jgi:enamine deaminase RidA (YjgF/YER057c/UK114 family)
VYGYLLDFDIWKISARAITTNILTMNKDNKPGRKLISSGSTFEQEIGYSRAVVDGDWIFVSGTTGFDYQTMTIQEGLVEQTEQCLRNIQAALAQAGADLSDVVRVVYVLPKASEFPECWPILRKYFGEIRPAAMMISAGLADPRMRIEIEVTARRQSSK